MNRASRILSSCKKGLFTISLSIASALFLVGLGLVAEPNTHVLIMHTNDLHGQLLPRAGVGGSAEIATIVRNAKPDLLLDGGDLFTGAIISDTFGGEPVIEVMNAIGYHASAVGNHEFDYGLDVLRMRVRQARFPMLSANLQLPIPEVQPATVFEIKDVRVGVIGLTTEELPTTSHPKNLKGVQVNELVKALENEIPKMRSRSDFIVLLTHIRESEEERVARAFPEVSLIVGGHSHDELVEPLWLGKTMVVRTGNFGRFVGRVDVEFDGKKAERMSGHLIPVKDVPPDPEIQKVIAPYEARVAEQLRRVVGEATRDLPRSTTDESPIANLVADAFRTKTRTQIALTNMGGIRTSIRQGPITMGTVFEVLPFQNTLVTMKLTGRRLKNTLGRAVMAVSGVRVTLDYSKPMGERFVSATLDDGTPILDERFYSVTTNDFLIAGGDGFTEFARGTEIEDTGILLRDALAEYVSRLKMVAPVLDGRVTVLR